MKITDLKPTIVWKFFHQVTQVPRPSKKEGKMIEFLESFAKEYKIAIKKDEAGNLLMSKPATPGMEIRSRRSSTANGCVPTALLWEPIMVSV